VITPAATGGQVRPGAGDHLGPPGLAVPNGEPNAAALRPHFIPGRSGPGVGSL